MTLQELNQRLVELESKLKETSERKWLLREEYELKIQNMLTEVFSSVLEEEDELSFSMNGYLTFKRPQEGYSYKKEVLSLYFREMNYQEPVVEEIQTSFYSTTENSEYELRRMILLGEVGKILLNSKEDILAKYNPILKEFSDKSLSSSVWEIEIKIQEVKNYIHLEEMKSLEKKLEEEGIEFEYNEDTYKSLPTLDIRSDFSVNYVKSIKVLLKTTSGKSANVKIVAVRVLRDFESGKTLFEEKEMFFDKVRMSNIKRLLTFGKNKISVS